MPYSEFREAFEKTVLEQVEEIGIEPNKLLKDFNDTGNCPFTLFTVEPGQQYDFFRFGWDVWFHIYYNSPKKQEEMVIDDSYLAAIVTLDVYGLVHFVFYSYPNRNGKSKQIGTRKVQMDIGDDPLLSPSRFVYQLYMQNVRFDCSPRSIGLVDFSKDQNPRNAQAMFGADDIDLYAAEPYEKGKPKLLMLEDVLKLDDKAMRDIFEDKEIYVPDEAELELERRLSEANCRGNGKVISIY